MDCAIITGADNRVGQAIARRVVDMGYRVYGLGQFKHGSPYEHRQFHPMGCDLTQPAQIAETLAIITREKQVISLVIHAATLAPGFDADQNFANLEPGKVETRLRIYFLGPVLLTRMILPRIEKKQGHIFFLSPQSILQTDSDPSLAGASAGVDRFARQLFETHRSSGLRVTTIHLQSNHPLPKKQFGGDQGGQENINPRQVATAVEQLLQTASKGNVITELVLRPQIPEGAPPVPKTETSLDPYREIMLPPPENFPSEPVAPVTPPQPLSQTIDHREVEKRKLPGEKVSSEPPRRPKSRRNKPDRRTETSGSPRSSESHSGKTEKSDHSGKKGRGSTPAKAAKKKRPRKKAVKRGKSSGKKQDGPPEKKDSPPAKKQSSEKRPSSRSRGGQKKN